MSRSDPEPPPKHLAHFEIIRRLGVGGMAEVFLAKKRGAENTFKLLVVKRVLPEHSASTRFRAMFAEEANLATRLNHPNIVQVYEFEHYAEEGQLLSMEYVEGLDLGRLLRAGRKRNAKIGAWVGAHIIAEVAKGLHYAHERKDERGGALGIVHRDVSPQNILLSYEGEVKIGDFGIATANLFRDEVGVLKGKFAYMSPEQARGERVDRRSDIYSCGVILHEILTGRPLHGGLSGDELLEAVRLSLVEPPSASEPDVPPELDAITMRALAPAREDRFASARDLSAAIARMMMQRQEFVDATAVEAVIDRLVSRETPALEQPGWRATGQATSDEANRPQSGAPWDDNTRAAVPSPRQGSDADGRTPAGSRESLAALSGGNGRGSLEVRHVAVCALHLHGIEALRACPDAVRALRAEDDIGKMLDQLAFKHGARFTWSAVDQARAIVGLMANPARAAFDACALAADIHEFLSNSSDDWPVPVQASLGLVRGIASGRRDRQGHLIDHELASPADFLASLAVARAPRGCTAVAGGLFRLVRGEFLWEESPPIEIDNAVERQLPRVMRIHSLLRPLSREEREANLAGAVSDLIGRDAEKADLHSAFHQVITARDIGSPSSAVTRVVVGEMGIGKSALVASFTHELGPEVVKVLIDGSPSHAEIPMSTVAELVRALTGTSAEQGREEAYDRILVALGGGRDFENVAFRLAELASGKTAEHSDEEDLSYLKKLILTGVRTLIGAITRDNPLVISLDGLQWADTDSLELIGEMLDTRGLGPLFAVLVTRPEERVLPHIERFVRIELHGLRPHEQLRLVESRLEVHDGVADVCADLVPRIGGNPFFLLEMVDALLERGTLEIQERDGRQVLVRLDAPDQRNQPLPSTLEQLIGDRLNELPPEEREVVRWLAVAGGPLSDSDLFALSQLGNEEPIARLCARGMCDRRGGSVDFRYPIARDVAYKAIDGRERVHMHRRLGEHLATTPLASGLSAVIVARHLTRGRSPSLAADCYLEAAQAARSAYQTEFATRYYRRVLSLVSKVDSRRLRAHEALESIYRVLGRHRARKKHLVALRLLAKRSGSARWIAIALTRTATFHHDEGYYAKGLPICHQACNAAEIARLPGLHVEALGVLSETLGELGDVQGALAACDRALEVARNRQVAPRARAEVLRSRGVLLQRVGRVREAVACHAEAIAVFRRAGSRRSEARAKSSLAFAMFVLERYEDSIGLSVASINIDLAIGGRFQLARTLTHIGQAYARLGDMTRAVAYLKRARDAHERYGDQHSRADTLLVSAEIMFENAEIESARAFCLDAAALISVTHNAYDNAHEKIVRAMLERASGDPASAIAQASDGRYAAEAHAFIGFHCHATAVEAAARVDGGETHTGILLATTALGAVAAMQGSEYGLEIRAICWDTLLRAGSPQAAQAHQQAAAHARQIADSIRDPRLKALFLQRPLVQGVLSATADSNPVAS